jgi:hypothetical protein
MGVVLVVLGSVSLGAAATSSESGRDDESGGFRYRYRPQAEVIEIAPAGSAEQALAIYNEFKSRPGGVTEQNVRDLMLKLYPAAGPDQKAHKMVALLIAKGLDEASTSAAFREKGFRDLRIAEADNMLMAHAREAMIEEVVLDIARRNKWEIARSNSGNIKSGMRSDLDQTFYVYRLDENGKRVRDFGLDTEFVKQLKDTWNTKFNPDGKGLSLEMLDVVSIEGKLNFPDARAWPTHVYTEMCHGTIGALRNIPGAYTTYGAQLQQVTKRAWEALERGSELAWQQFGPRDPANPGGEYVKRAEPDLELARRTICLGAPELLRGHAFNAAVSNYLELLHYMTAEKFETKYHLRTFDDAMFTKYCLDMGTGLRGKQDYADMSAENRRLYADHVLKQLFGDRPDAAEKVAMHAEALEISRAYRLLHKTQDPKALMEIEAFARHGSVPTDPAAQRQLILEPLLKRLYPEPAALKGVPGEAAQHIGQVELHAAESCYRRLASEFCLESIHHTSVEAFRVMRSPELSDSCRFLLGDMPEAEWHQTRQNIAENARISLLYSIYDLGAMGSLEMMRRLDAQAPGQRLDLFKIWLEGRVAPVHAFRANPQAYLDNFRGQLAELKVRAGLHLLSEFGFEKAVEVDVAHLILDNQALAWNWRKLGRNMFGPDLGTVQSISQVIRSYVVSQGDPNVVLATVGDEIFLAIPVVGQAAGAARGGVSGFVLLGTALKWPVLGKIMIIYSIGQAFYTIYEIEYLAPSKNNLENAIYRGFAGPEVKDYGTPGRPLPVWGDTDQGELDRLNRQLAAADPVAQMLRDGGAGLLLPGGFVLPEEQRRREREFQALKAELEPRIAELDARRQAFLAYRDSDYAGRAATVTDLKRVDRSLLDAVTPRLGFFTGGVVDFGAAFDPEKDPARMEALRQKSRSASTLEETAKAEAELFELQVQQDRYERAQRYLAESAKSLELALRIRRDSLFSYFEKSGQTPEAFVDAWFARNEEAVAKQLVTHGLLADAQWKISGWMADVPVESVSEEMRRQNKATIFPLDIKQAVKQRLAADLERGKQLTLAYRELEKGRLEQQQRNIEDGIRRIKNEIFGLAVTDLQNDPRFAEFLKALPYANIRRVRPRVEATFFKKVEDPRQSAAGKADEPLREHVLISAAVDVFADQTLYLPYSADQPYKVRTQVLAAEDPLPDEMTADARQALQALKSKHAQALQEKRGVLALASVYCAGVANLSGAMKETYEGLPAMDKQGAHGDILMAQRVGFIPIETLKVRVDPVRVLVTDLAGRPLADVQDLVRIGSQPAKPSKSEYWGTHTFTKYGEKIPIVATYRMPDGTAVEGRAELAVTDVANWYDPQPPKDPITIRLPIYGPGSLKLVGRVAAQAPPQRPFPATALVFNKALEVSTGVRIPGGDNGTRKIVDYLTQTLGAAAAGLAETFADKVPADGTFEAVVRAPVRAGTPLTLVALGATAEDDFQGEVRVDLPAAPGTVNVGTLVLKAITQTVTVPGWDRPVLAKAYLEQLASTRLRGRPQLGAAAPDRDRQYTVQATLPEPGARVRVGTEVVVTAYGQFARRVPNVVGLPAKDAVKALTDLGFKTTQTLGPPATSEAGQFRVASQSVAPETEHPPDQPIGLVVRGAFAPALRMPRILGLTEAGARTALKAAGIEARLEVVDRQKPPQDPARADTIYQQAPAENAPVGTQEAVRLWLFAGRTAPPPSRPFYVVFRVVWPKLKEGIEAPKKNEGESDESYCERKRRFYSGLVESQFDWVPQSDDKNLLVFNISNEALGMYPREMFVRGEPYAIGVDGRFKNKAGGAEALRGALLLQAAGTVDTMEQLLETFPALRAKEKLEALAFTNRDGTMTRSDPSSMFVLGPIRKGWSPEDRKAAVDLATAIFSAFDCFIATTVYANPVAEPVEVLRRFRDEVLLKSAAGRRLVELYYLHGPRLATVVMEKPSLARPTRRVLDGAVWFLKHVDVERGAARQAIDAGLASLEKVLRAVLPHSDSVMDEFGRAVIQTRFLHAPEPAPSEPPPDAERKGTP